MRREFDPHAVYTLTFDCYGTLVDWLGGVRTWASGCADLDGVDLARLVRDRDAADRELILGPYRPYSEVLGESMTRAARAQGRELPPRSARSFAESMSAWPPFDETRTALTRLAENHQLAILSNVETATLARTVERLGARFELCLAAEDLRSYKPAEAHFAEARRLLNLPRRRILHVGCSRFHDIEPASRLGWPTAWVDREREGLAAGGSEPDLVVPDLTALCAALGCGPDAPEA